MMSVKDPLGLRLSAVVDVLDLLEMLAAWGPRVP
jgi:hypothetical protein